MDLESDALLASGIVTFSDALTVDQEAGTVAAGRGETGKIGSERNCLMVVWTIKPGETPDGVRSII